MSATKIEKGYIVLKIKETAQETEDMLNEYRDQGYRVVCSYSPANMYLILNKEY